MSLHPPERSSPKPIDQSLLDTILEPEFTAMSLFSGSLGCEYTQQVRSHDRNSGAMALEGGDSKTKPWGSLGGSKSSLKLVDGFNEFPCNEMRRQRIHRTETGNHETRSRNSLVTISSFESLCTHVVQQKNDSTELEEEYAQFLPSPPVTPPGREEYFRDMKAQQKEVQRRVLPPITAVSTPSSFIQPQGPHPNKQLKYIPNFSRPFSRSNPPAVQNAIWRTRMRGQEIQDDAEPEPLDRYLRGKLDEHLLTKKIEGLRKEVEMIDERGDEWKKALGILEETELKMALEMSMEMKEDGDDYGSLDCAKVG